MNSSINDSKTKYVTNGRSLYMALLTLLCLSQIHCSNNQNLAHVLNTRHVLGDNFKLTDLHINKLPFQK